jgi:hypothetical protein
MWVAGKAERLFLRLRKRSTFALDWAMTVRVVKPQRRQV